MCQVASYTVLLYCNYVILVSAGVGTWYRMKKSFVNNTPDSYVNANNVKYSIPNVM